MFADRVLEKLYDGCEVIDSPLKVDYLLLLMRGNNVTITDNFVYYCQELMSALNYNYFLNRLDSQHNYLNILCGDNIATFFSMAIGLEFCLSYNLRMMIKSHLSKDRYHVFHIALDYYYNLLKSPKDLKTIRNLIPKKRFNLILRCLKRKLASEEQEKKRLERKKYLVMMAKVNERNQRGERSSKEKRKKIEQAESMKRSANRARIAKRAGLNRESNHSVWSTNIILTNMGGKR